MRALPPLAAALLLLAVVLARGQQHPAPAPVTAQEQWAYALAAALGNEAPSSDLIAVLVAWQRAEGGNAQHNPLNTTQPWPGSTRYNSVGVQHYASAEDGLAATVATLQAGYPGYAQIVSGIQRNDPTLVLRGLAASPWGTSAALAAQVYREERPAQVWGDVRARAVALALREVGKPYVLGTEGPATFDCSGLIQYVYGQLGVDVTRTTYTQLDALRPLSPAQLQPGDLVYFQYPTDQHVGMLADVNGDGRYDMIHAGAPSTGVIITSDVFHDPFYASAIIGYRAAV